MIRKTYQCPSLLPWHKVRIGSHTRDNVYYDVLIPLPDDDAKEYICQCLGFQFKGQCSHQREAWQQFCGYETTEPTILCPLCGSPLIQSLEYYE